MPLVNLTLGQMVFVNELTLEPKVASEHGTSYMIENFHIEEQNYENAKMGEITLLCTHCHKYYQKLRFMVSIQHIMADRDLDGNNYGGSFFMYTKPGHSHPTSLVITDFLYEMSGLKKHISIERPLPKRLIQGKGPLNPNILFRFKKYGR
jgi:hypothetical protein